MPQIVAYERLRQDTGFHFVDQVQREAKAIPGIGALNASSYVVRTTINPQLQRATESILQEGLARYELNTGRVKFQGAGGQSDRRDPGPGRRTTKLTGPAWLAALKNVRLPLYDVHWEPAVVVENGRTKKRRRDQCRARRRPAAAAQYLERERSGAR